MSAISLNILPSSSSPWARTIRVSAKKFMFRKAPFASCCSMLQQLRLRAQHIDCSIVAFLMLTSPLPGRTFGDWIDPTATAKDCLARFF